MLGWYHDMVIHGLKSLENMGGWAGNLLLALSRICLSMTRLQQKRNSYTTTVTIRLMPPTNNGDMPSVHRHDRCPRHYKRQKGIV